MASFTDVVAGNVTFATDINQIIDALNGTTSVDVKLIGSFGVGNSAAAVPGISLNAVAINAEAPNTVTIRGAAGLASGNVDTVFINSTGGRLLFNSDYVWHWSGKFTVATTAPASPATNDIWINIA